MELSLESIYKASHSVGQQLRYFQESGQKEAEDAKRKDWNLFYSNLTDEQKEIAASALSVGLLGLNW